MRAMGNATKRERSRSSETSSTKHSHWATEAALFHAGARLEIGVEPHWGGDA